MSIQTLPEHRFSGAYRPTETPIQTLGICPCGCHEAVTGNYVYVEWEGDYFVDRDHLFKYIGAVEIG